MIETPDCMECGEDMLMYNVVWDFSFSPPRGMMLWKCPDCEEKFLKEEERIKAGGLPLEELYDDISDDIMEDR